MSTVNISLGDLAKRLGCELKGDAAMVITGVAGMEAAWIAAARGHEVTVLGRSPAVGGKTRLHSLLPGGESLSSIYDYQFAAAAGMTRYSDELAPYLGVLFPQEKLEHILGQVAAEAGRAQLRTAETEKYPHVTYFLNGGQETTFPGEDRIMVPSPKVATYDLQPEMSAPELTDKVVAAVNQLANSAVTPPAPNTCFGANCPNAWGWASRR